MAVRKVLLYFKKKCLICTLISLLLVGMFKICSKSDVEHFPIAKNGLHLFRDSWNSKVSHTQNEEEMVLEMVNILKEKSLLPNDKQNVTYSQACEQNVKPCVGPCENPLSPSPSIRLKKLLFSPNLTLSDKRREKILSIGRAIPLNDVIIVSASSSNHFKEVQAMFHNLHTKIYPYTRNFSVVLFDIGLTANEKQLATIARARKAIVWQDSSIRWVDDIQFQALLDRTEKFGQQLTILDTSSHVVAHTSKQTFDYINEMPCAFLPFPEVVGGFHLHKNDPLVVRAVLEPWARCVLEESCIKPSRSLNSIFCSPKKVFLHICHRFDQSILTLLTAMLYSGDVYKFISHETDFYNPKYIAIKRHDEMPDYFKASVSVKA